MRLRPRPRFVNNGRLFGLYIHYLLNNRLYLKEVLIMSFSPSLASAFNNTRNRSPFQSPQSGMCSLCTED